MRIRQLMVAVATVAVVLWGAIEAWRWHQLMEFKQRCVFKDFADLASDYGDFTKVPLDWSPYLRDVAEPITLIRGGTVAGSDNHHLDVTFVDRRDVERNATWAFYIYAGGDISNSLMLGGKVVPPRSPEERAFLGLLQRWYRGDAEAQAFHDHLERSKLSGLTERQMAKVISVAILRKLLKRD
jgi:hypothetical protein